jgi:hypothetical protein
LPAKNRAAASALKSKSELGKLRKIVILKYLVFYGVPDEHRLYIYFRASAHSKKSQCGKNRGLMMILRNGVLAMSGGENEEPLGSILFLD